jgi:hypothetical protein
MFSDISFIQSWASRLRQALSNVIEFEVTQVELQVSKEWRLIALGIVSETRDTEDLKDCF